MSFVEKIIILCPYLGESTIRGSTVNVSEFPSTEKLNAIQSRKNTHQTTYIRLILCKLTRGNPTVHNVIYREHTLYKNTYTVLICVDNKIVSTYMQSFIRGHHAIPGMYVYVRA